MNCHQTTETSDLIGGLRPVRGRTAAASEMFRAVRELIQQWPDKSTLKDFDIPEFLYLDMEGNDDRKCPDLSEDAVSAMMRLTKSLWASRSTENSAGSSVSDSDSSKRKAKRPKLGVTMQTQGDSKADPFTALSLVVVQIEDAYHRYNALFEWADGPLVLAMKHGDMILLDEMSLADDAVLERLNSVLEPSRTLVLAEKGSVDDDESRIVRAHSSFLLFATMNPGGDFGKRELSPALRSRFTEIWVPPVTDHDDVRLVLERTLSECNLPVSSVAVKHRMMEYVTWFNEKVCTNPARPCSEAYVVIA